MKEDSKHLRLTVIYKGRELYYVVCNSPSVKANYSRSSSDIDEVDCKKCLKLMKSRWLMPKGDKGK